MNRKERRQQAQRQARRKNMIAAVILVIALLLVAGSLYAYFSESQTATVALDYGPEDIVYDQPIHAIHEMGDGPPIPFLANDQPQPAIAVSEKSYDFGSIGPICRLKYSDDFADWEFAIFKFSSDTYDPDEWMFPGYQYLNGTIEGALKAGLEAYPV